MSARIFALALVASVPAGATDLAPVTLRQHVVVTGPVVTLGDLFENAGARAVLQLGPAPAPGQRWLLEAPQLSLIARDNSLPWRPAAADERVVVERPGRPLAREAVIEALMAELQTLGAPADLEPYLPGFVPPFLPEAAPEPRLVMEGTRFDPATRRFTATLLMLAEGMPPVRQPLSGRLMTMRTVVVTARALRADTVIGPDDVVLRRIPADQLREGRIAEDLQVAIGSRLRRAVGSDRPVALSELIPVVVLRHGSPVLLTHEAPGLAITAQGRVLEDGTMGATIPVLNLATGTVVLAQVLGPDRVRPLGLPRSGGSR